MSGITLSFAQGRLDAYLTAELKVLSGQSYQVEGKQLTRANLSEIRNGIDYWQKKVNDLSAGNGLQVIGATIAY